jgi:hypothetical protein
MSGTFQHPTANVLRTKTEVPQYGVEVEGIGAVISSMPLSFTVAPARMPTAFENEADAERLAEQVQQTYTRMGCPDEAKRVRVVARTVTTTCSRWTPVGQYVPPQT